jgi:hypothetical protein
VINGISPFLNLTEHDFATNVADQVVKKSKHVAIDKEWQVISQWLERAEHNVDSVERLVGIEQHWQHGDAEYQKILEYINNRKSVRLVEELQGLVVSRLMELDKVNLAGSGM